MVDSSLEEDRIDPRLLDDFAARFNIVELLKHLGRDNTGAKNGVRAPANLFSNQAFATTTNIDLSAPSQTTMLGNDTQRTSLDNGTFGRILSNFSPPTPLTRFSPPSSPAFNLHHQIMNNNNQHGHNQQGLRPTAPYPQVNADENDADGWSRPVFPTSNARGQSYITHYPNPNHAAVATPSWRNGNRFSILEPRSGYSPPLVPSSYVQPPPLQPNNARTPLLPPQSNKFLDIPAINALPAAMPLQEHTQSLLPVQNTGLIQSNAHQEHKQNPRLAQNAQTIGNRTEDLPNSNGLPPPPNYHGLLPPSPRASAALLRDDRYVPRPAQNTRPIQLNAPQEHGQGPWPAPNTPPIEPKAPAKGRNAKTKVSWDDRHAPSDPPSTDPRDRTSVARDWENSRQNDNVDTTDTQARMNDRVFAW